MFNHKSCDLVALILSAKIPFKLSCIPEVISHITAHIHQGNPFMMYVYINNHIYCKYLTILFANYTSIKLRGGRKEIGGGKEEGSQLANSKFKHQNFFLAPLFILSPGQYQLYIWLHFLSHCVLVPCFLHISSATF